MTNELKAIHDMINNAKQNLSRAANALEGSGKDFNKTSLALKEMVGDLDCDIRALQPNK